MASLPPDRSHILTEQRNPRTMRLHELSADLRDPSLAGVPFYRASADVMARVVGHVQQDSRSETGRQVLDERAPTGAVAPGRRREERRLAGRPLHVAIAGEAPEPDRKSVV